MSDPQQPSAETPSADEWNALAGNRVLPGRSVVLGMVGFALLMVAAMFTYWELYTRPFRPLQAAIAAEFKGSSPRAIGGRHKSHRPDSPAILRIIVRIDWDPRDHEIDARGMANALVDIARRTVPLEEYDRLEIHLMHRRPEQWTITWSVDAPRERFPLPVSGPLADDVRVRIAEGVEGT
jgi:hypothetical protein